MKIKVRGSWGQKKSEKILWIEEVWRPPGTRTVPVRAGRGDYTASDTCSPGFVGSIVYGTCNIEQLLCFKKLQFEYVSFIGITKSIMYQWRGE